MYPIQHLDIDVKGLCAGIPYYSIRSIFEPSEAGRILDRGVTDWDDEFKTKHPIQLPASRFQAYEIQTLIYAAEFGQSIQERFMALSELKNRGYLFDEQNGWINTSENKCIDRETWKEKPL